MAATTPYTATSADIKTIKVMSEYDNVLLKQQVFAWEPVVWVQNRMGNILGYSVVLMDGGKVLHPLTTWTSVGDAVVAKEHRPQSAVWETLSKLNDELGDNPLMQDAVTFDVDVLNYTNNIMVSKDLIRSAFTVSSLVGYSYTSFGDERLDLVDSQSVLIQPHRFDIMDTITGDMSSFEKINIDVTLASEPSMEEIERQIKFVEDTIKGGNLTDYAFVIFTLRDVDDTVYITKSW